MSKDITKFFTKVIDQISLMSKERGGGIFNAGMLGEGSSAKITAEPVKTSLSNKEEIVVAWDLTIEALLLQVKDYERIAYFNGRDTSVLFDDYQKVVDDAAQGDPSDSDFYPLVKDLPLSVMVDVQSDGKANVKLTGKKRVESLDGNVFIFTNQEILDMVEDYQITFNVDSPTTVEITLAGSNGTIDWGDGAVEDLTVEEKTYSHTYSAAGSFTITQAHELTKISCRTPEVSGNIDQVSGLTNLTYLRIDTTQITGDISAVSGLTNLTALSLCCTQVEGDISAVSGLTNLTYLNLDSLQIEGDVENIKRLTSLSVLNLHLTQITGDISAVSGLTNLTYLRTDTTQITGDISAVSGLTNLTYLRVGGTNISGDIASVKSLTALSVLGLNDAYISNYTSTDLPAWSECDIDLKNLNLSDDEVSDFVIDLDNADGTDGSLDISGNNGTIYAGSEAEAAIQHLQDKGWAVTYNDEQQS